MTNNAISQSPANGRLPTAVKRLPRFIMAKIEELRNLQEEHARINTKLVRYQIISYTLGGILILTVILITANQLI